jgi:hypothetical protein
MNAVKKPNMWEIFIKNFKDIVFVIMFLATTIGWITTSVSDKTEIKMTLQENTKTINELKKQVEDINTYIKEQSELNGKIIQYMEMDSK